MMTSMLISTTGKSMPLMTWDQIVIWMSGAPGRRMMATDTATMIVNSQ